MSEHRRAALQWVGLVGGPALALVCYALVKETSVVVANGEGGVIDFGHAGRATLALLVWMATWWLTEAIDITATALLPLAVLPLVTYDTFTPPIAAMRAAAEPYANPFIALFLGGFLLALAMERWGLHRRIALIALRCVGTRPRHVIAGFMAITAVMSMWVSNTATTVLMLPVALSVIRMRDTVAATEETARFKLCLMLGIAYAASVGGIGTLIGTPPNLILAGFVQETYGVEISFARWLLVGVPVVVIFVPMIWLMLTRVIYPLPAGPRSAPADSAHSIRAAQNELGRMKPGEWATFLIFMATALAWIVRPILTDGLSAGASLTDPSASAPKMIIPPLAPGLTDAGIAVIAAVALFVIPVNVRRREFVMDWETAKRVPWGILILFGGGLSLAAAVTRHGVADYLGHQAGALQGWPPALVVLIVVAGIILLTEMASNTASTAALLPILASIAPTLGVHPFALLVPATIAASCAFMMPVATPPNAIVFGSGHVTIPQMSRAGLWINLVGVALIMLITYTIVLPVLARGTTVG